MDHYIQQIKEMQRSDPEAKEQWIEYCNASGGGKRDPAKHDAEFIESFITNFNAGLRFEPNNAGGGGGAGGGSNGGLQELFKQGQRKAPGWKEAWAMYCMTFGAGKNDPAKHNDEFLTGFLDFVSERGTMSLGFGMGMGGKCGKGGKSGKGGMDGMGGMGGMGMGGMGMGGMGGMGGMRGMGGMGMGGMGGKGGKAGMAGMGMGGMGMGGPAAKRPRTEFQSSGDPVKDELVVRIKAFQRSGDEQKQQWWDHADTNLGGLRDPAKHDVDVLEQFASTYGVP